MGPRYENAMILSNPNRFPLVNVASLARIAEPREIDFRAGG
jgi:hypothetical protein